MAVVPDSPPPPPLPLEGLEGEELTHTQTRSSINAGNTVVSETVNILNDPPPPYPSRDGRRAPRRPGRRLNQNVQHIQTSHLHPHHQQYSSSDSQYDARTSPVSPGGGGGMHTDEEGEPTETTLLLSHGTSGRPRSYSHASTMSAAPSFVQTVFSLFQTEEDGDGDERYLRVEEEQHEQHARSGGADGERRGRVRRGFFSVAAWKRYFRPLARRAYYSSFLHLAVINFPYALAAWVYLFVFTVTGATLLMALPLGAVLCFFNLLGARTFARGELSLQYRFHYPLSYPPPYPPRPIFTRYREPSLSEVESGRAVEGRLVRETSFYRNTYAMFTDSTSYQALFYFLVIKPAITLLLSIAIWAVGVPFMVLVLPAPAVLRAVRRLGIWQANVSIEGLYLAVR
ncbi:hypothetical protein D9756_010368 [Leucocoprinus leucothites]|uniref:Sensor domain-containing protein n=1 Tax=Leucocoprinus leucothites TaxID=201217 RepID=A0A8H5CSA7_9AGAR|nr:hypothetical protein D9756_010368 [Leucoagaricus leucothites]